MPTISLGEVEMILLVSKQLVAVAVHGEQAEGGVAPAIWGHRGAHHDGAIHPCLVLHLRGRGEIAQVLDSSLSLFPPPPPPLLSLSPSLSLSLPTSANSSWWVWPNRCPTIVFLNRLVRFK